MKEPEKDDDFGFNEIYDWPEDVEPPEGWIRLDDKIVKNSSSTENRNESF